MRFEMQDDFCVEFEHRQFENKVVVRFPNGREITPRGFTHCTLKTKQGVIIAEGLAWCRDIDQFNKNIGRLISQGRALKAWSTGKALSDKYFPYVLEQVRQRSLEETWDQTND